MINRYSSRITRLDHSFLTPRLNGALSYDRIAGYFSSSLLEIAGEAIETISGPVRIVCNSRLDPRDVETARTAHAALLQEWCSSTPENISPRVHNRFEKLGLLLKSKKIEVRVLPDESFGLIHGKAGVITLQDGSKTSFMGSVNESVSGWVLNYELLWEDNDPAAVAWVQSEFDALWHHHSAYPLPEAVILDIERIAQRKVYSSIKEWEDEPDPGPFIVEAPVSREQIGLWEHQKYFINIAFQAHQSEAGARYILADEVGLGKTIQLASTAALIGLSGTKPILIIAPKTLLFQWQDEMRDLLGVPSAVWTGKRWIDESGVEYPESGEEGVTRCPRKIGILSQGLITRLYQEENSRLITSLLNVRYDCIIVDEAHRARRSNITKVETEEKAYPNNLMAFLLDIAGNTKSMLLATATPVQLHPIEAYDLISIIAAGGNETVLGTSDSRWRHFPIVSLRLAQGLEQANSESFDMWVWISNPLPPSQEGIEFQIIRRKLRIPDTQAYAHGFDDWNRLSEPDKTRISRLGRSFFKDHNPFIRHIIRRTRSHLETTLNPETGEPYLKPVKVILHGEDNKGSLFLNAYLQDAYNEAEEFCSLLKRRARGTGFMKTLLLRRVGSSLRAGRITAEKMLGISSLIGSEVEEDDEDVEQVEVSPLFAGMPSDEREHLQRFRQILIEHEHEDPKISKIEEILLKDGWLERGCIIFSQYFDSVELVAKHLSSVLPDEIIGIYAGGSRSGFWFHGVFQRSSRERVKNMVKSKEMRLLIGTDAASEGLNLQTLGTLINLDLPWNPTRLEQRKGRIQRIGQIFDDVWIYNIRYSDSVEDRVHELLSARLQNISTMFGQLPDVLEDVWVQVALGEIAEAERTINGVPEQHPFSLRYERPMEPIPWERCSKVLDRDEIREVLKKGW